jgi:hypothetical protein
MVVLVTENREVSIEGASSDSQALWLSNDDVEHVLGWTMKPEGLCKDDVCITVPRDRTGEFVDGDSVNIVAFWERMNRPAVSAADGRVWYLGDGAKERADVLASLKAPDFSLPDLQGVTHRLSDYRGSKVLLATWASW